MPDPKLSNKPGNATVKQTGHTAGRYGVDPNLKVKGGDKTRDLNIK